MANKTNDTVLRFMTCGSVDDGKSTLIGRMLFDTKTILTDTLNQIEKTSKKRGMTAVDLSLITDGLQAEREQGITIDVAYRYFSTGTRKYIIADAPGHEQYTRNMVTAASTAECAIILIDARKGILTQTKRHTYLSTLVGIKHILVAINKMDLIDFDEEQYKHIQADYLTFFEAIKDQKTQVDFIPMSALEGDMIVERGNRLSWYNGPTLLEYLENLDVSDKNSMQELRLPVQFVCRPQESSNKALHDFRGFMGRIESGTLKVNDKIKVLPSGHHSEIKDVRIGDDFIQEGITDQSVTITLKDEIDISRGDMIVHKGDNIASTKDLTAMVCWLSETPLTVNRTYLMMHTARSSKAKITQIKHKIDVNTLREEFGDKLNVNDIAEISFKLAQPLVIDTYEKNRVTGAFILVDESSLHTVAAGMVKSIDS